MLTDAALTRMLRALGAERRRLEQEIRRLEKIVEEKPGRNGSNAETEISLPTRWRHGETRRS